MIEVKIKLIKKKVMGLTPGPGFTDRPKGS